MIVASRISMNSAPATRSAIPRGKGREFAAEVIALNVMATGDFGVVGRAERDRAHRNRGREQNRLRTAIAYPAGSTRLTEVASRSVRAHQNTPHAGARTGAYTITR